MPSDIEWVDLGPVEQFPEGSVTEARIGDRLVAVSFRRGRFGAISGVCNHVGGPLGQGRMEGEYVVCPWHNWRFHRRTGQTRSRSQAVPGHAVRTEGGRLLVSRKPVTPRRKPPRERHPLARPVRREDGPIRIAGISTTAMDRENPRFSTSEFLLTHALDHAGSALGCETRLIRLNDLAIRPCEGYYSKSAHACTWPCSITTTEDEDRMADVYEALIHWADVTLLSTPIRWGAASSLYFKMAERLNCVQNQITIRDRVLIRNKVAGFIITGGQDNIQAVAGQLLTFFSELGFHFPQFPFIAHSRGWSAEDMEQNIEHVQHSEALRSGARELAGRAVEMAKILLGWERPLGRIERGGRKAHRPQSAG